MSADHIQPFAAQDRIAECLEGRQGKPNRGDHTIPSSTKVEATGTCPVATSDTSRPNRRPRIRPRLQACFVTTNPGHHGAIVPIRVQALDGFAQSSVHRRNARITVGGVEKHAGFIAIGRNADGGLD